MYRSSFGPTIDGLQKPEIIAPGIWLAAPILPGTPTADEAALLDKLKAAPDSDLQAILQAHVGINADLDAVSESAPYLIRQLLAVKIHDANVISGHYKHVDGTSFAAPIVASIVAQILESRPHLKPHQVKRILIDTARRIENVPIEKQGWGMVLPGLAMERTLQMN
jgi:serine protease AprX